MRIVRKIHDRHTLKMAKLYAYRRGWDWNHFKGTGACIKWSFRDLENLEAALRFTKGRRLVVQAGANLGIFPKRLAEEFQQVLTFEPDLQLFQWAKHNAPEKNIKMVQAALGCTREKVGLSQRRRDGTNRPVHEGLTHVFGEGEIRQVLIDDFDLPACDLIYLDIEGYEYNALRGGIETIKKYKPVIGVEINRNITQYGVTADEFRSWLRGLGYKFMFSMNSDEVYKHVG